ncbi:MAG: hypothetical protein OXG72_02730, partial [Acidobacteria bacterium]|nr:hypothetical protein [Acidobacteriota bacterium]
MDNDTPTNDTPTNGAAAGRTTHEATSTADQHTASGLRAATAGGSLNNAEFAALSRERQQTLLSILPPAVAAILITNRPPMPPHVEYEAHKKLV